MKTKRTKKIVTDSIILLCSGILLFCIYAGNVDRKRISILFLFLLLSIIVSIIDLVVQLNRKKVVSGNDQPANDMAIRQLILLDDHNKPIKSWELSGKIAVVIGKHNEEGEVDVDLDDCEYSTFINPQHAVLNFCQNVWFVEDLKSQNGVKIKKVEDGICYKVLNRPCRVMPGDIIYIANTRLLLT